ncbi:MAG: hypothetical protein AAB300_03430, partial [Nitrospirota bacterium]
MVSNLVKEPLPDPIVHIRLSGEGYQHGFAKIGEEVKIFVVIVNGVGIDLEALRVDVTRNQINEGDVQTSGASGFRFTPKRSGRYLISASVADKWGKAFSGATSFWAEEEGGIPLSIPGPPEMVSMTPPDESEDIPIDAAFEIIVSELVVNANSDTIKLFYKSGGKREETPIDVQMESAGGGMTVVKVVPKRNMVFGGEYELEVGNLDMPIVDVNGEKMVPQVATFKTFELRKGTPSLDLVLPRDEARLGDYLYILDWDKENMYRRTHLKVADITNAESPLFIGSPISLGRTIAIAVSDEYYFASRNTDKVAVITYRADMPMSMHASMPQQHVSPFIGGNFISNSYTSVSATVVTGRVGVYDIADPANPKAIGTGMVTEDGVAIRVAVKGKYAYVSTVNVGLQVVDLEKVVDPAHRTRVTHLPPGGAMAPSAKFKDNIVVSTWAMQDAPRDLVIVEDLLYVLSPTNLLVFDISSEPLGPMVMAKSLTSGLRLVVAKDIRYKDGSGKEHRGDVAFVSTGSGKTIDIYDVTVAPVADGVTPGIKLIGTWKVGGTVGEMLAFRDKGILVANVFKGNEEETVIFDLKTISNVPKELGGVSNAYRMPLIANEAKTHFMTVSGSPGTGVAVDKWGGVTWKDPVTDEKMKGVVTDGAARVRAEIEIKGLVTQKNSIVKAEVVLKDDKGNGGFCGSMDAVECTATEFPVALVKEGGVYVIATSTPAYYQGPATFVRFGDKEKEDKAEKSREVKVVVQLNGEEIATGKIILKRPPIILVHG